MNNILNSLTAKRELLTREVNKLNEKTANLYLSLSSKLISQELNIQSNELIEYEKNVSEFELRKKELELTEKAISEHM